MVEMIEIPLDAIEGHIYLTFEDDNELLAKYHTIDKTLLECVEHLMSQIRIMVEHNQAKCYGVFLDWQPIGFTVAGPKYLFSFGIDPNFRTKEILIEWMECVKLVLGEEFVVWLYNENTRAINFFLKNDFEEVEKNNEFTTLAYINN